jgi:hypothetical protein
MIRHVYQLAKSKAWKKYLLPLQPLLLFVGLQIAAAIYLDQCCLHIYLKFD